MSGRRDQHESEFTTGQIARPTLADLDHLDTSRAPSDDDLPQVTVEPRYSRPATAVPRSRGGRRGWLIPLLLLVLIGLLAVVWFNQNRLRGMLPRTELNDVLGRAQQALQSVHLDGQDGTSARELFQQAVALEPDNDRAHDGLRQVGQAELSQADAALRRRDISTRAAATGQW